jgi:NTE family protein
LQFVAGHAKTSAFEHMRAALGHPSKTSPETAGKLFAGMMAHLEGQIGEFAKQVPAEHAEHFRETCQNECLKVLASAFARAQDASLSISRSGKLSSGELGRQLGNACQDAIRFMDNEAAGMLQESLGQQRQSTPAPQLIALPGQEGEPHGFTLLHQAPPIENLVFKGGGMKGIGYGPALSELQKAGALEHVCRVSGSSVGGLAATLLAAGMPPQEFDQFSASLDFKGLREGIDNAKLIYPSAKANGFGLYSGLRALKALDEQSALSISGWLQQNWNTPDFQNKLAELPPDDAARLATLREKPDFSKDRSESMATFRDLQLLRAVGGNTFKELTLTGWDKKNQSTVYFNAQNTPNMPIALAGRISMSMPLYFRSIEYDLGDNQGPRHLTDGGTGSNMPAEVFENRIEAQNTENVDGEVQGQYSRTLLLGFDEQGKADRMRFGAPHFESHHSAYSLNGVLSWLATGSATMQNENFGKDRKKLYDSGPNGFIVHHGKLGTKSFGAAPEKIEEARRDATQKAREWLALYGTYYTNATMSHCATAEEAAALLTAPERAALLAKGKPPEGSPEGRLFDAAAAIEAEKLTQSQRDGLLRQAPPPEAGTGERAVYDAVAQKAAPQVQILE